MRDVISYNLCVYNLQAEYRQFHYLTIECGTTGWGANFYNCLKRSSMKIIEITSSSFVKLVICKNINFNIVLIILTA